MWRLVALGLMALLAAPSAADAQLPLRSYECVDDLTDAEVRERVAFLQARLDEGTRGSRAWWAGWLALNATAGVTQLVIVGTAEDTGRRVDAAVASVGPALGAALLVFRPLTGSFGANRVRRAPARTAAERRRQLRIAEVLLNRSARRERRERGWLAHSATLGFAGITSLVLWLGFDRPRSALRNFYFNLGGGEVRIATVPRTGMEGWDAYVARFGHPGCEVPDVPRRLRTRLSLAPTALTLTVDL